MTNENITRIIIYITIASLIGYDILCGIKGWATITSQIRWLNEQTGWIIALFMAALWFHFFWNGIADWAIYFIREIRK